MVDGKKKKERACVELGFTRNHVNRFVKAYKENGKSIFQHGNRGKKPKHAMPDDLKKKIISKYQTYGIDRPNITHFCELLAEEDDLVYSDTTIRKLLYQAELLSPKTHRKTRKRLKREWRANRRDSNEVEGLSTLLPCAEQYLEEPEKAHPLVDVHSLLDLGISLNVFQNYRLSRILIAKFLSPCHTNSFQSTLAFTVFKVLDKIKSTRNSNA